jgi:hypothetical protein
MPGLGRGELTDQAGLSERHWHWMTQRLPGPHLMIASSRPRLGCPALGGPLGRRTGVVVLAPVPGRRCGLDNAGAGPSSGAARRLRDRHRPES